MTSFPNPQSRIIKVLCVAALLIMGIGAYFQLHPEWSPAGQGRSIAGAAMHFLYKLFFLDGEQTVPAWFTSTLWTLLGMELIYIRHNRLGAAGRHPLVYLVMALACIYFSIDETCSIHEQSQAIINKLLKTYHPETWIWVAPFSCLALILCCIGWRPFRELPRAIQALSLAGAGIFILGAAGGELLGAYASLKQNSFAFNLEVVFEESMEMLGLITFIHGQALFIAQYSRHADKTVYGEAGLMGAPVDSAAA